MTNQQTIKVLAARRRIKIGDEFIDGPKKLTDPVTVEHLVPQAHLWYRNESLLHTGWLQEVEVPVEDLFASFELRKLDSATCLQILHNLGLKDQVELMGPHKTPRVPSPDRRKPPARESKELAPDRKGGPGTYRRRTTPVKAKKQAHTRSEATAPDRTVVAKKTTTSRQRRGSAPEIPLTTVE